MFSWNEVREHIDKNPFRRRNSTLIKPACYLKSRIIFALDTGTRLGDILAMTWADVDAKPEWFRLRGETTKSGVETDTKSVEVGTPPNVARRHSM
jgi:integrase